MIALVALGVNEHWARRQGADRLVEIEGDLLEAPTVYSELGH